MPESQQGKGRDLAVGLAFQRLSCYHKGHKGEPFEIVAKTPSDAACDTPLSANAFNSHSFGVEGPLGDVVEF